MKYRDQQNKQQAQEASSALQNGSSRPVQIFKVVESNDNTIDPSSNDGKDSMKDIVEMAPKNLKGKAKIFIQFLRAHKANVDENLHIMYNDGTVGSHLFDIFKYVATSALMSTSRPWDTVKFVNEVCALFCGVPAPVYGPGKQQILSGFCKRSRNHVTGNREKRYSKQRKTNR